jgi:hypothetical protein
LGLAGTLFGATAMHPSSTLTDAARMALAGIVPASIGISHLVSAAISRQKSPTRVLVRAAGRY